MTHKNLIGEKYLSFNKIFFGFLILTFSAFSQYGGFAGSYSRLGTSAFSVSVGNAVMSNAKYISNGIANPALLPFMNKTNISATTNFLSLDRKLFNFGFSKNIKPSAGFGITAIVSSTNKIDGRDNDGFHTEDYSITEQQYILSFGNKIGKNFSVGMNAKIFYAKLFEELTSTTVGFDFGTLYKINSTTFVAFVIKDINSSYKWDTSNLYNESGNSTDNIFPTLNNFSITKLFLDEKLIVSAEVEKSSLIKNYIFRTGASFEINKILKLQTGFDRIIFEKNNYLTFSGGFIINFEDFVKDLSLEYSFGNEPFNLFSRHVLTINYNL